MSQKKEEKSNVRLRTCLEQLIDSKQIITRRTRRRNDDDDDDERISILYSIVVVSLLCFALLLLHLLVRQSRWKLRSISILSSDDNHLDHSCEMNSHFLHSSVLFEEKKREKRFDADLQRLFFFSVDLKIHFFSFFSAFVAH